MSSKAAQLAERLKKDFSGPMNEEEAAFLRDVQGFIEFAIRNGLSFPQTVGGLLHDFNQVVQAGFDFAKVRSSGVAPKVAGYSKLSSEDFGDSSDQESSE